ncbi:conjugative transposon protein TraK [Pedobacter sp. ISL-68]|uniref:conjugative transposon protein TraK n=1 Tax=unclassified Pedobacter TaxID=2628915 RepID=UPI001BE5AA00|nr:MULTISPECIES: conjugative transposon protein TraK [unclassified Pedobacter]MBT2561293.1 conjugative transposon protein TraK [Pedobacter sp. ISL-64]MBT2590683.1 conjugative transposon protein TraK [Pedobacter sp. ISL-68]
MFTKTKNIDTAFRHIKRFSIIVISISVLLSALTIFKAFQTISVLQSKVYVVANGKVLEAYAAERKDNIPVEAKDHIRTFHEFFFTLSPDEKLIQANVTRALYLADGSAKKQYDNLKESNYYDNIISGNLSQVVSMDSITLNLDQQPYSFRFYGKQVITRTTSIATRSLITEGLLRTVSRSDNNPHGFLIERWNIIENKDIDIKTR